MMKMKSLQFHCKNKSTKLIMLCVLFLNACRFSFSSDIVKTDINKDGNVDCWTYISNGYVEKQEMDMNFDGKIDSVYLYESDNKIKEEMLDTNYDGKIDNWRLYKDGELVIDKIDSNHDGKVDTLFYIDRGKIYKIEVDKDKDGTIDQIINY